MPDSHLRLSIALSDRPHTAAVKSGEIVPDGVTLEFVDVSPMVIAFRRMVRTLDFDVCELAPTTYLAAREQGVPIVALPVFITRRFHHGDIVCRPGSGIREPRDLVGERVGLRAYTVSTAVWCRGILAREYGVDCDAVTWVVDDEEHVQIQLPPNVEHTAEGDSVAGQFARGELVAALTGAAGIGRSGAPKEGWTIAGQGKDDARRASNAFYPLFSQADVLEADWYRRTGIYPIHGLIAIKTEIVEANPWVVRSLMDVFTAAKDRFLAELASGKSDSKEHKVYSAMRSIVGEDPLPYGVEANRKTLEAMVEYSHDQHIINHSPEVEELFASGDAVAV